MIVRGHQGRRILTVDRGDVDDRPGLLPLDDAGGGAATVERPRQSHVQDASPFLVCQFHHGCHVLPQAGIADQIDHEQLNYAHVGRNFRLTDVYGHVVREILA